MEDNGTVPYVVNTTRDAAEVATERLERVLNVKLHCLELATKSYNPADRGDSVLSIAKAYYDWIMEF